MACLGDAAEFGEVLDGFVALEKMGFLERGECRERAEVKLKETTYYH